MGTYYPLVLPLSDGTVFTVSYGYSESAVVVQATATDRFGVAAAPGVLHGYQVKVVVVAPLT